MIVRQLFAPRLALIMAIGNCAMIAAQQPNQLAPDFLANAKPGFGSTYVASKLQALTQSKIGGPKAAANKGLSGIDSLVNFTGQFSTFGYDPFGNPNTQWQYAMVGNPPERGGTTMFKAPVIPVSLDLRDANGNSLYYYDATQYVDAIMNSPIFQDSSYSSSDKPTQFTDAVQRAEFADRAKDNWHTLLNAKVMTPRVMTLDADSYYFALNPDGSCCAYVLVDSDAFNSKLFPATYPVDNTTIVGAAELAGDMKTTDITTFLFPNTYLYSGNLNNCCVLGFHTFDYEPGIKSGNLPRAYVMNYSSWISPGLFGASFQDVTALSHELSETFNDPFVAFDGVHNITPWWLSPNGECQPVMEVGDVIEGLDNATFPITLNGYTYHPQNEALLPWFEFQSPSQALNGAYSYPDGTVLTSLSPVEKPNCM